MKMKIRFDVDVPNYMLEDAIRMRGVDDVLEHAYRYAESNLLKTFHKPNEQEVSNIDLSVEYERRKKWNIR